MPQYCTHGDVANYLQTDAFSGSTTPTSTTVDTRITESEQYIDEYTNHTWHSDRYQTVTKEPLRFQKYRVTSVGWRGRAQIKHYPLASLTALHVWDGSQYVDYVASGSYTAGSFTDPLSGNYWTDSTNGYVYLKTLPGFTLGSAPNGVGAYATYTYGTASTPKTVKKAAILLTAADIVSNQDFGLTVGEGPAGMSNETKAERFRAEAHTLLDSPQLGGRSIAMARNTGSVSWLSAAL